MKRFHAVQHYKDVILLDLISDEYFILDCENLQKSEIISKICAELGVDDIEIKNGLLDESKKSGFLEERWYPVKSKFSPNGNVVFFILLLINSCKYQFLSKKALRDGWSFILSLTSEKERDYTCDEKQLIIQIGLWMIENSFFLSTGKSDCLITSIFLKKYLNEKKNKIKPSYWCKKSPFFFPCMD